MADEFSFSARLASASCLRSASGEVNANGLQLDKPASALRANCALYFCAASGGNCAAMSRTAARSLVMSLRLSSSMRSADLSSKLAEAIRSISGVAESSHSRERLSIAALFSCERAGTFGTLGKFNGTPRTTALARLRARAAAKRSTVDCCASLDCASRMALNMARSIFPMVS